jgi:hypothetical protein
MCETVGRGRETVSRGPEAGMERSCEVLAVKC